ncbi:cellulase family glycosylhydrolase [Ruminococcus sp.]|uniref:cellulase family glycosylhydrolase n=1 Tax=Ruminococcus sp. TaxID=41978 RepID=UPI001B2BDDDB|nr:cellulase family glycosylhydrolase [Ruminococcus sp.]MBO5557630.1 cellulase family glycosylhydrolase [Ruminococcus sp.]
MNKVFKRMTAAASVAALTLSFAAASMPAVVTASAATSAVNDTNDDWLHAKGSRLYDKNGNEVWLTGANWFGFNCTECAPHYLWSGDIDDMVKDIADHGVNVLRLPVSTELLYNWMIGDPDPISSVNPNDDPNYPINVDLIINGEVANSQQTFEVLLAKCKKYGVKCFIDIHSPESNNSGHNYGLWYGKSFKGRDGKNVTVTTDLWIETLAWAADHYKNDDTLIGFDLKNEPHSTYGGAPVDAIWDNSNAPNNWKKAAEDCANAILAKNPDALILIEGVEGFEGHGAWWGGNLRGVAKYPILPESGTSQIVYSPHDYGPVVSDQPWFHKDFTEQTLLDDYWYDTWAYLVEKDMYPLLIGEWGGRLDGGDNEKWLGLLRDYMIKHHVNHTFWCLNDDSGDTGGLWKDIQFGVVRDGAGNIKGKTTINWDTEKYDTYYYPAIWKTQTTKKPIGLDHQVALGKDGISLNDFYANYASTEGSNLDGGTKVQHSDPIIIDPETTAVVKNLTYTAAENSAKLSWSAASGAEGYAVYQKNGSSWKKLAETSATSYTVTGLTSGVVYQIAVVAKSNGTWGTDYSNAINVMAKDVAGTVTYPTNVQVAYSEQYHQVRFTWDKVNNAQNYGIAVYLAGKWRIQTQSISASTLSYTTPKNLTAGKSYKVAIAAKVNGTWDVANAIKNAVTITVK